jgi:hypothetical protein
VLSSTYEADSACPAAPDKSQGYVWPIYPTYRLLRTDPKARLGSGKLIPLEKNPPPGYHAEATVCKDGKIVFTSNRNGDLDLYVARIGEDGFLADIRQVTFDLGYDGGAFFSPDCSKLLWRASRPRPGPEAEDYQRLLKQNLIRPGQLELWVGNADGSNARQVTRLGAASFAPFFTPDGKNILFAANPNDPRGRKFDIYMISEQGIGLEQVTHSGTFDSFPMFSPDGKRLAFSSNRLARKPRDTNVFVADWDATIPFPRKIPSTSDTDPANRFYADVAYLSSPELQGRGVGNAGFQKAVAHVEERMRTIGLKPAGEVFPKLEKVLKNYAHPVSVQLGAEMDSSTNHLFSTHQSGVLGVDFRVGGFSSNGKVRAFIESVDYGLVAPDLGIDDYRSKNVAGKIVLVKRFVPKGLKLTPAQEKNYGDLRFKAYLARERGARAILFYDAESENPATVEKASMHEIDALVSDAGLPVLFLSKNWGETLSKSGIEWQIETQVRRTEVPSQNVVGVLEGKKGACRASRPVLIGAHLDHLGLGGSSSLEPGGQGVHHGADDNASGVAAMLEIATQLRDRKSAGCYLFVAFTAEEIGIVGSSSLERTLRGAGVRMKAMLNLDMVGRMTENRVLVFGTESAKEWSGLLRPVCEELMLKCPGSGDGYGPSDHMPFYIQGVPVLHFFTGAHTDYHRPSDVVSKINATGGVQIAELVTRIAEASVSQNLSYQRAKATTSTVGGIRAQGDQKSYGAYLGTIPSYADMNSASGPGGDSSQAGVKLAGARAGSPAEKAGVREGDILKAIHVKDSNADTPQASGSSGTAWVSKRIMNLQDFMYVLTSLRPGDSIQLMLRRGEEDILLDTIVGRKP